MRQFRIDTINDTVKVFQNMSYFNGTETVKIDKGHLDTCVNSTIKLDYNDVCLNTHEMDLPYDGNNQNKKAELLIQSIDSFDMGIYMKEQKGLNPVVLNMASMNHPGGGYLRGAGAQEESLFRRSCLHLCLDGKNKKDKSLYPISVTKNSAIYTKDVIVIKDNESHNYSFYRHDYKRMSVITCPAFKCKKHMTSEEYDAYVYGVMYNKLDMIFRTAFYNGHDSIVLGAFGCGAFHNPSLKVAYMCQELYKKYAHCFKMIGFAILTDHNDIENAKQNNSHTNFETFKLVFNSQTNY